jgi:succinate dehydrogenase/fumarate reductase flavoprotein subunit
VRVARDGRTEDQPARAVVLATGGFQGNPELLSRYVLRNPDHLYLRAGAWSTGDAFLAGMQIGAAASPGLDTFYGHALAAPPARFTNLAFRDVTQFYGRRSVAVNLRGERFADESDGNAEDTLNQRLAQQPEGKGFYIIDCEVLETPPIPGHDAVTRVIVERARAARGPVVMADTLQELCRGLAQFGVPERKLLRELEDFNRMVESDAVSELQPARRSNRSGLRHAPFCAVAVKASITFTMGGLHIDEHARVLRRAGGSSPSYPVPAARGLSDADSAVIALGSDYRQMPIQGLYAAGCDAGNISHFTYLGGLATALTTGRRAGTSAARLIAKLAE